MFLDYSTYSEWSGSCQLSMQILMGDFNQTRLLVLHLLPHQLVGLTLLAVPLWGQCKIPHFLAQMFALFPQEQKRSICSCRFRGLSSPSLSESLRSWRSQVCAQPVWGPCSGVGTGSVLPADPSGGAAVCARLCPAAAVCGEGQDAVLARGDTTLSPPWPPPPSIWDCGQSVLPCWPQLYPTIVSVCSFKSQKKCREKRRCCPVSVEHQPSIPWLCLDLEVLLQKDSSGEKPHWW